MSQKKKEDLRIEEKLLLSLIDREKTTGELSKILGYIDKRGYPDYKNIEKQLKKLKRKGFVKSRGNVKVNQPGRRPTFWWIERDIRTIKTIREEYPKLFPYYQQNDSVIDIMVNEHKSIFPHYDKLKKMLRASPTFFDLCLLPEKILKERLHDTFKFLPEESQIDKGSFYTTQYFFFIWCTRQDIMEGIFTEDALRLIKTETVSDMSNHELANSYLAAARAKKRAAELVNDEGAKELLKKEAKEDIARWKEVIKSKITLQNE